MSQSDEHATAIDGEALFMPALINLCLSVLIAAISLLGLDVHGWAFFHLSLFLLMVACVIPIERWANSWFTIRAVAPSCWLIMILSITVATWILLWFEKTINAIYGTGARLLYCLVVVLVSGAKSSPLRRAIYWARLLIGAPIILALAVPVWILMFALMPIRSTMWKTEDESFCFGDSYRFSVFLNVLHLPWAAWIALVRRGELG